MATCTYKFTVEVYVTLDDNDGKYQFPEDLSAETLALVENSFSETNYHNDGLKDGIFDVEKCPVADLRIVLE